MNDIERHPITFKPLLYQAEGMDAVDVRRDVAYAAAESGSLTFDLYMPASRAAAPPVVVLVTGYPDVGVPRRLGCAFKEMAMWSSLGRLLAVSGMAAVGYTSAAPARDIDVLIDYLSEQGPALGIDATRVGLWATSGHAPTALGALARRRPAIKAAVLSTGFTLDITESIVAEAARAYGFATAAATLDDLPTDVPLFIARGGHDEIPGLNRALDRFVGAALTRNWPVTIVNHASAGHAFELNDDSAASRFLIRRMLAFAQFWLGG